MMEFMEYIIEMHGKLLDRQNQLKREVYTAEQEITELNVELSCLVAVLTKIEPILELPNIEKYLQELGL